MVTYNMVFIYKIYTVFIYNIKTIAQPVMIAIVL